MEERRALCLVGCGGNLVCDLPGFVFVFVVLTVVSLSFLFTFFSCVFDLSGFTWLCSSTSPRFALLHTALPFAGSQADSHFLIPPTTAVIFSSLSIQTTKVDNGFVCFVDFVSGSVANDIYSVNSGFMSAECHVTMDVRSKTQIGFNKYFDCRALWIFPF